MLRTRRIRRQKYDGHDYCVFRTTYGVLLGSLPLVLTNGTALVVNLALITLKIRYRNNP